MFSAAFVAVAGEGPSLVPGTTRRLTFSGARGLSLGADDSAWSDPIAFDVQAFQRLTISLGVVEASDVSMDTLGLASTYVAAGGRTEDVSGAAFAAIPANAPDSTTPEYPIWWVTMVDVQSANAAGAIVAVGDSWVDGRCSTTENGSRQA